jgi:hypothetical protein
MLRRQKLRVMIAIEEYERTFIRGLRGGSSGGGSKGGGGYSSGGGSSYRGSSHYGNSGGGGVPIGVVIALIVGVIVLITAVCICKRREQAAIKQKKETFQERIADLRQQAKDHAATNLSTGSPTDGVYKLSYLSGGFNKTGFATLSFVENGKGFDITGEIQDADGLSKINEGFASYDGKAYWVDTSTSSSLIVVSDGVFDFDNSTFAGKWEADTGEESLYTSFELTNKPSPSSEPVAPESTTQPAVTDDANDNVGVVSLFDQMISGTTKK